jgi:hypothetical protein
VIDMRKRLRKKKDKQEVIKMVNNGILDDLKHQQCNGVHMQANRYPILDREVSKFLAHSV